jgi:hypothetical protein
MIIIISYDVEIYMTSILGRSWVYRRWVEQSSLHNRCSQWRRTQASSSLLYTWRLLWEGAGNPKPIIRNGEVGIYCAVGTHSLGCRRGKHINGQSGGHSVTSPAGKSSAWRLNCRHIYFCIRCRIKNSASHITIKMLLSPFSTLRYAGRDW